MFSKSFMLVFFFFKLQLNLHKSESESTSALLVSQLFRQSTTENPALFDWKTRLVKVLWALCLTVCKKDFTG